MKNCIHETEFIGSGTVLVASPYEFSSIFKESCVLIYDCTTERASGVLIQSPTAFVMGEMTPGDIKPFDANPLFTGGDGGDDTAIMIGKYDLGGYSKPVGNSGLYVGGLREAKAYVNDKTRNIHPLDFKFFYKSCEWTIRQLDNELSNGLWKCVTLPTEDILVQNSEYSVYNKVRNGLQSEDAWKWPRGTDMP